MHEKVIDSKKRLIERIVDRDADDDLAARVALRQRLQEKTRHELEIILGNPEQRK